MTQHSRQNSFASSFVSSSAIGLGISNKSTPTKNPIKIGPWKLGKTLGKGSTGRVLLATNVNTNQNAAVKVISKSILNSADKDANSDSDQGLSFGIEREIIIMKLLNHKNVLRLYDVWETDKALYLVLEYVEGGELFDLMVESGPLPEEIAVEFFKQIVLGVSYCHSLGICHRDLKPENLLLDKQFNIKIADFGMAALELNEKLLETSCGSPHYAAPEIVSGLQYHGSESDVWSCGVILFALLTARLPFDDENIRDLLQKVQKGEYELDEDISNEAKDLISLMLTVDPEERIKTRDILKHPLIKKYPFNKQDLEDYLNLPSPNSATKPINSREEIDKQILENLVILWHGRPAEEIINALLCPKSNPEKTFYLLLLRYRHDHNNSGSGSNPRELVRTSSVISKVTPNSSGSSTPKKKRLSQSFSASSSHRKLTTFQSSKSITPTKPSKEYDISNAPPVQQAGAYNELVQHKRGMKTSPEKSVDNLVNKRLTMSSALSNKRNSMLFLNEVANNNNNNNNNNDSNNRNSIITDKRASVLLSNSDNKRSSMVFSRTLSKRKSATKLKRNSVTSKLLSTYAKLASLEEKNTKNIESYGRRTSADFGTLCDMLFNGENIEGSELTNSDSMATLSALIFGSEKRASKRASISPAKKRSSRSTKSPLASAKKRHSSYATALLNESPTKKKSNNKRASSNPMERISRILNANEIENLNLRSTSVTTTGGKKRVPSVGPPPKPMSKLDPRFQVYEQYQRRVSMSAEALLKNAEEQAQKEQDEQDEQDENDQNDQNDQQSVAGTITREFISEMKKARIFDSQYGDLNLKDNKSTIKKDHQVGGKNIPIVDEEQEGLISSNTVVRRSRIPTTLAEVKVPQVTRRSKHFPGNDKRFSLLSVYSTKESSTNLNSFLKDLDDEDEDDNDSVLPIEKLITKNTFGRDANSRLSKSTRLSMVFNDEDVNADDTVDMQFQLKTPTKISTRKNVKSTVGGDDDGLYFIGNNSSSKKQRNSLLFSVDDIPKLNFKDSKDTLISSTSFNKGYKALNLPEIPGSPIKEEQKRKSQQSNFDIYDDGKGNVAPKKPSDAPRDSQRTVINDDDHYDAQLEAYGSYDNESERTNITPSRRAPLPPQIDGVVKATKDKNGELQFKKQRKPLGDIDDVTKARNANENNKRSGSSSFFRKMSFGKKLNNDQEQQKQQQQQQRDDKRKVSLGQAFLNLFSGDSDNSNHQSTTQLLTILTEDDFFEALKSLLISWKQHGIKDLNIEQNKRKLVATISKKNALGLKSCKFGCEIVSCNRINKKSKIQANSKLIFTNLKGSSKSFHRLTDEIQKILDKEDILVK
ncbi:hypothetical protein CANARDRAFT_212833 [[Candida] arabinofermentans NRRL YB-2248]|uniref:non-specific serine/threonine protein kinase n=1 Tax=[Candida] arabinofermentans NRRL YB-2248 TaxID=983967 RepID=A0A1E4T0P3_9ASCO|nr:hypothetical protein CANARDRAFT_212833 [[Candida] arabinofermentans NRRL YB-2248]